MRRDSIQRIDIPIHKSNERRNTTVFFSHGLSFPRMLYTQLHLLLRLYRYPTTITSQWLHKQTLFRFASKVSIRLQVKGYYQLLVTIIRRFVNEINKVVVYRSTRWTLCPDGVSSSSWFLLQPYCGSIRFQIHHFITLRQTNFYLVFDCFGRESCRKL